jgi:hypothetical protein
VEVPVDFLAVVEVADPDEPAGPEVRSNFPSAVEPWSPIAFTV